MGALRVRSTGALRCGKEIVDYRQKMVVGFNLGKK